MIKTKTLLTKLAKSFPKRIAAKYHDHVGLMTGKLPENINKVLLCLDFDEQVLPYALKEKPDIIITHHPFIYGTKYRVFKNDPLRKALCEAIDEAGIPVYSMHTNFDEGKGGMNDALAKALDLSDIKPLETEPMARGGILPKEMKIEEFALYAKDKLHCTYGHLVAYGSKTIKSAAIIGGGGGYLFTHAQDEGYDIYISGDAAHHVRRAVVSHQYNYLDLPHEIERIFMPTMKNILLGYDNTLDVVIIDHEIEAKVI